MPFHFRDVQGSVSRFQEAFLGEENYNPLNVMRLLKRVRFTGFILDDHVPRMSGNSEYATTASGYAHLAPRAASQPPACLPSPCASLSDAPW